MLCPANMLGVMCAIILAAPACLCSHRRAQKLVDASMITAPLPPEPSKHIGIKPNGERFLYGPVKLAHHRPAPVSHLGLIREIDLRISQRREFPAALPSAF